jgi:HD-GYP domain-containing protein (c-di-GMP phosphodiesterase class II)
LTILSDLFDTTYESLLKERSYFEIFKNDANVSYLKKLFIDILSNALCRKSILRLKSVDEITFFHSFDVFVLGALFMKEMGYPNVFRCAKGFLLHDVGKIDIPLDILLKESGLTSSEKEVMKKHSQFGYNRLIKFESQFIADMAKYHHEKFDGTGYPTGIKLSELAPENQMLTFLDHFSALTLERPYKPAFDFPTSFRFMEESLGNEHFQMFYGNFKKIFIYNKDDKC